MHAKLLIVFSQFKVGILTGKSSFYPPPPKKKEAIFDPIRYQPRVLAEPVYIP